MTKTTKKLDGALDRTTGAAKGAAKSAAKDTKGFVHRIGRAIKAGADEVATVAGQTLETVGRQMKDTTKPAPHAKK